VKRETTPLIRGAKIALGYHFSARHRTNVAHTGGARNCRLGFYFLPAPAKTAESASTRNVELNRLCAAGPSTDAFWRAVEAEQHSGEASMIELNP